MPLPSDFPRPHTRPGRTRGFALLITITLLAFLVLLLVSLASLTRVETQVATNNQSLSQARQNALMALNIALGQLQKTAGPDQRITAKADVLTSYAGSPVATDTSAQFDTFWQTRNRAWTGIWGNNATQIGYTLTPSQVTGSGTSRELLGWLVSGNEASTFTVAANGGTSSASASKFTPNLQVAGLSATVDPVSTALTFPVANTAAGTTTTRGALLVGPASSSDGTTAGKTASFNAGNFVAAPIIDIQVPASTVPGLGSAATPTTIGGYAYWVGDEGVKARVNLRDSYQRQSVPADQTAFQRYSFITSQRSAVELVNYDTATALSTDFPFSASSIGNIQTVNQLGFTGATAAAQGHLLVASANRFHDITAHSQGVLADTYAGGLKKDLTADIADATSSSTATRPGDADPLFPRENAADIVPTWGLLRSFPRTQPSGGGLNPTPSTATAPGVYPVINFASLGLDFFLDSSDRLQIALFPCVALWNPTATTIKATTYEFGFRTQAGGLVQLQTKPPAGSFSTVATLDLATGQLVAGTSTGGAGGFIRFRLQCPDIPPGENHVFTLGSNAVVYDGSNLMTRVPVSGATGVANGALWQVPATVNAATDNFRVTISQAGTTGTADALNFVLAQPGTLTNTTNTSGWYQAVIDARPGRLGAPPSGGVMTLKADTALSTMPDTSSGATAAFRISAMMEARGSWNDNQTNMGSFGRGRNRWLVMGNVRAPLIRNTSTDNSGQARGNILFGSVINLPDYNPGRDIVLPYLNYRYQYRLGIGGSQETNPNGYQPAMLFDVLASRDLFLSVGQLQHAQLARYGFHNTYPFGNAWADVRIPRAQHYLANQVSPDLATGFTHTLYDLSWHLNRSLWDKYFVSGVPSTWTAADVSLERPLPNGRFAYMRRNGATPALGDIQFSGGTNTAYDRAAANLAVEGAFNINSTSEQAWRAFLAGTYQLPQNTDYADTGDAIATLAPVPRISGKPNTIAASYPATAANTMRTSSAYFGNRGLLMPGATTNTLPAIINELARTLVTEVRARGPFLSLADFVNRRVAAGDTGIKGTLQSAIDTMTPSTTGNGAEVNPYSWTSGGAFINTGEKPVAAWDTEHYMGGPLAAVGTNKDGFRTRGVSVPKYLTQADLLSLLGPALSARSDTFRIRTYGEVKNPVTGDITGRAWCEAVVQRSPDYLNSTADTADTAPSALTNAKNREFGRRFIVISFRWLSPSDL